VSLSSHRTRAHVAKLTPPRPLRRDRLGRLAATTTTRSFARPVFASFRPPSRALRSRRPLRTRDTINHHLVRRLLAIPILVHAKTALLQVPGRPRSGRNKAMSSSEAQITIAAQNSDGGLFLKVGMGLLLRFFFYSRL
jgi:hypothetical protein